jgi:hypothetical protein
MARQLHDEGEVTIEFLACGGHAHAVARTIPVKTLKRIIRLLPSRRRVVD